MSDTKYRQRGYQDDDRDRPPSRSAAAGARTGRARRGPADLAGRARNINMPGYREVVRCAQCGNVGHRGRRLDSRCPRCGTDLHACAQCTSFDPGSRFECMQTDSGADVARRTPNTCTLYAPRTTVERETTTPRTDDARKAFDDLFKF